MRYLRWWLKQLNLRLQHAGRDPYDLSANHALVVEIDQHYETRPPGWWDK